MGNRTSKLIPYIVWDGLSLIQFRYTREYDCMILQDGLISVQNLMRESVSKGSDVIIIFSCKTNMPSYEICSSNNQWGGLFTISSMKVLNDNSNLSIRDFIINTNIEMQKSGLNQTCEVICKLDLLDLKYPLKEQPDKKILIMQFDMCRFKNDLDLKVNKFKILNVMTNNPLEDFTGLIRENNTNTPVLKYRIKDLHNIAGILLTVIDSGFVSWLMSIFKLWSQKHHNATIKITYQSDKGKQIEITYTQLRERDVQDILIDNPPKIGDIVKLELPPFDNMK